MAAVLVVDSRVNPNDPTQRVELWGNGTINSYNCPPVLDGPQNWFDRLDLPVAAAIHIVDWVAMSGYVLDRQGGVHPFGGAPTTGWEKSNVHDTDTHYLVPGIPYVSTPIYVDWSWNPFAAGRGVALDGFGTLHNFGGAPQAPRGLNRWNQSTIARKLLMNWVDLKAYTLDYSGGIHADYNAVPVPGITRVLQPELKQAGDIPYWLRRDMARDFHISDWGAAPKGYTLDKWGAVLGWGGAPFAHGFVHNMTGDWARRLHVLNPADPLRMQVIGSWAQQHIWSASTKPTLVAGGLGPSPADTTSSTTRPSLNWTYSDPQQDSQAKVRVLVFSASFYVGVTMTDPAAHAANAVVDITVTDPDTRGVVCPVDLDNGTYRVYMQATDTSDLSSDWSSRQWVQDVPVPATPTEMSSYPDHEAGVVHLSVKPPTGGVATLVRFEYTDETAATDSTVWNAVRGAGAVPLEATTSAVDRDAPLGLQRTYRARAYSVDPRTISQPSGMTVQRVDLYEHVLTAVSDATLGGIIRVIEAPDWSRPVGGGVFEPLYPPGSTQVQYPTVVSDGAPKARRTKLTIEADGKAEWTKLERLLSRNTLMVHRDPFGDVIYCRIMPGSDWSRKQRLVAPYEGEKTPWRHNHVVDLSLVEVRPPNLAS